MKLLIIGASGVFGSRIYTDAVKRRWNVLGTYCSHEASGLFNLDLRDRKSIERVFNFFNPEAVVLAGGITNVDFCESKPKLAFEVNVKGTLAVIKKVRKLDCKPVFLSTDYIFNGEDGPYKEGDRPSPLNVYGRTKLEIETAIKDTLEDYLIVRTSQLYGLDYRYNNYTMKIIRSMRNNRKIYTAYDLYSTPTYAGSLSKVVLGLLELDERGVFNVAGRDFLSRYEYVNKISDIFSLDKTLIQKVKLESLKLKAPRPKRAGLEISKVEKIFKDEGLSCNRGLGLLKKELEFL